MLSSELTTKIADLTGRGTDLWQAYERCLPAQPLLTLARLSGPRTLSYAVSWIERSGQVVATTARILHLHEGGALELHCCGTWADPAWRQRGLTANLFAAEQDLLTEHSNHIDTRITLRAGRAREEGVGVYLWSRFGFDFADTHQMRSEVLVYPSGRVPDDDPTKSDLDLQRARFAAWVQGRADAAELMAKSATWRRPHDLVTFHPAGRTYLLSLEAAEWDGVFLVNREDFWGKPIAAQYLRAHGQRCEPLRIEVSAMITQFHRTIEDGAASTQERVDALVCLSACDSVAPPLVKMVEKALEHDLAQHPRRVDRMRRELKRRDIRSPRWRLI